MNTRSYSRNLSRPIPRPFARLRKMLAVRRQRLTLRELDERALADIGLTREAARAEANRPLWDLPTQIFW